MFFPPCYLHPLNYSENFLSSGDFEDIWNRKTALRWLKKLPASCLCLVLMIKNVIVYYNVLLKSNIVQWSLKTLENAETHQSTIQGKRLNFPDICIMYNDITTKVL